MSSSMNASHLNSAGNRTKTVTLSLLLKIMALRAPETKNVQFTIKPIPLPRKTGYPVEFNSPNMLTANIVSNNSLPTIILNSLVVWLLRPVQFCHTQCALELHVMRIKGLASGLADNFIAIGRSMAIHVDQLGI